MSIFNKFRRRKRDRYTDSQEQTQESPKPINVVSTPLTDPDTVIHDDSIDDIGEDIINDYISFIAKSEFNNEVGDYLSISWDALFNECARLVVIHQMGSETLIQKKFSIGYARAGRIMDGLEAVGIVGPSKGYKPRDVYVTDEETLDKILNEMPFTPCPTDTLSKITVAQGIALSTKYSDEISKAKDALYEELREDKLIEAEQELEREKETIRQELLEKERIKQLRREVRRELTESGQIGQVTKRQPIPQDIQDKVWNRDGGKCVNCGSNESLEFDHIIPFSKGGSSTYRNIQLLCEKCNRQKSNNIGH